MSKRMIITTAVLSCLLCTSCAAAEKAEIPDLKGDMSVSGRVACDGVTAQAEFTRSAGVWTVSFTSPDSVKGLTVTDDGNTVRYSLDGIEYEYGSSCARRPPQPQSFSRSALTVQEQQKTSPPVKVPTS